MTKYREIIRLTGLGFSQRNIMASCGVSQKTVVKVQKRARELNISWPLDESMTDTELQRLMFSKESKVSAKKRMPDYDYIRKELLRNGGCPLGEVPSRSGFGSKSPFYLAFVRQTGMTPKRYAARERNLVNLEIENEVLL